MYIFTGLPPASCNSSIRFPNPTSPCTCTIGPRAGGTAGDGAVVRALASHQCGPGSNPGVDALCGLSLLLVLSFALRGFSPDTPVFPSPQKPTFPNSNSTRNQVDEEPLCGCATSKSLFNYLFIYSIRIRFSSISFTFLARNQIFKTKAKE